MQPVCVIADDFTGAAEMAGIAWQFGHRTILLRDPVPSQADADVVVYDASTRNLPPDEAADRLRAFCRVADVARIFKKIDSALRGNVLPEARAMLNTLRRRRAIILAQNPSRGRTIAGGIYRIDGVPITQTFFRDDPDHPVTIDHVVTRLDPTGAFGARSVAVPPGGSDSDIVLADADAAAHVERWAEHVSDDDLPVGGSDFFIAVLHRWLTRKPCAPTSLASPARRLHVCGTASRPPDVRLSTVQLKRPDPTELASASERHRHIAAYIGGPIDRTPGSAERLQRQLIDAVGPVVRSGRIDQLLVEGGATAAALFDELRWSQFEIVTELATGVVALRSCAARDLVILTKPGSYDWPATLFIA